MPAKDNTISEITIDQFDGGIANNTRNAPANTFALTKHFDVTQNKLIPYRDMKAEAGTLGVYAIKSVAVFTDSAGAQNLFALGNVSGQTYPQFLEKSVNMVTGTFATSTNGNSAAGTVIATSLMGYKKTNKLYCLKTNGGNTIVTSYDPAADALVETVGTITGTSSSGFYPRPFRHPQDDILYFGAGNVVASLNNTTFTAAALTLPTGLIITSFTDYGVYLAIACAPIDQSRKSYMFLWNRDTSLTTVQEVVDFGEGSLMVLDNVGGSLVGVSVTSQATASVFDIAPKVVLREYTGGLARPWREIKWTGTGSSTLYLPNLKAKKNDYLYFALKNYMENQTVYQIWTVGKNSRGQLYVTADRLGNNDTAVTSIDGLDIIGDYLWVGLNSDGTLNRTDNTANFTATPTYDSMIFNGGDPAKKKSLKMVTVMTEAQPTAGQIQCYYRKDEETVYTRLFIDGTDNSISHASTRINNATEGGDTVTMTIASPCVVTLNAHKLVAGQPFKFLTSGALPTGVVAGQTYYVISTGLAANTFQFSATSGGSAVNSSGSQSGTHKLDRDAQLPTFKEIQIRIESMGGTVISGLKVKYEVIGKELA